MTVRRRRTSASRGGLTGTLLRAGPAPRPLFQTNLTPWSDGIRVKTAAPFKTPWRTIQLADDAVGLLNSSLILNLNEPNALGDVSWVEPGKYVCIWWAMHIRKRTWGSGPIHGATTAETRRYMDFAAKYGFAGVLVEGWNVGWDSDWFSTATCSASPSPIRTSMSGRGRAGRSWACA
jgi:alpha-glucosidase